MESVEVLQKIAAQVRVCERCPLCFSRKHAVPGAGAADSDVFLIGEGPGFYENEQGLPFVGPSGKFLDELLLRAGLDRERVFITNVVKCRPPGNRDPQPEELAACKDYLERQIATINPRLIVTLGRFSMATFLSNAKISEIHGQPRWVKSRLVVPMYHPAAALHQPTLRSVVEADFARLPEWLEKAKQERPQVETPAEENDGPAQDDDNALQMSLF